MCFRLNHETTLMQRQQQMSCEKQSKGRVGSQYFLCIRLILCVCEFVNMGVRDLVAAGGGGGGYYVFPFTLHLRQVVYL